MRALAHVGFALFGSAFMCSQNATVFGVAAPGSYLPPEGDPFLGYYDGRSFISLESAQTDAELTIPSIGGIREWFPPGTALQALSADGKRTEVVVQGTVRSQGDLYTGSLSVRPRTGGAWSAEAPILFWRGDAGVEAIQPATIGPVDAKTDSTLRAESRVLWERALAGHPERADIIRMDVGEPRVWRFQGNDAVTVSVPVRFTWQRGNVDSAAVFMVYSERAKELRFAMFGHSVWYPDAPNVRLFEPKLFFRIAGDSRIYCLARVAGPWEALGFAVVDVTEGRVALMTEVD